MVFFENGALSASAQLPFQLTPPMKQTPQSLRLGIALIVAVAAPVALRAQAVSAAPTAAQLAKYDTNKNGRLDPAETAAMQADEAKARAAVGTGSATTPGDDTVQLSPFEVREANKGYYATSTMSGTRLNTKLEDLASSISVVTKQQMQDFALLDINDIFNYEASTEGTGNYTAFEVDRNGMVSDQIQSNPQGANRIRGIGAANLSLNNFATSGRMPIDPSMIDSVEISRGPNSNIFGLGEGSGTVNLVGATANFNRASSSIEGRLDDRGGWRTSLDLNRPLIRGKLGLRVTGVQQHIGYFLKPSGFDEKRFNAMVRAQPFRSTSIRASFQSYRGSGTRPNSMTPRDNISWWKSIGSPMWDPIGVTDPANAANQLYTVTYANGTRQTVTNGTNPTILVNGVSVAALGGQNFANPILYVDRGGIQLWQISRKPAANATNGAANNAGFDRMLESLPEPVRTNRPLFSTVPGVTDKSIYDWSSINLASPNFLQDSIDTSTVEVEQYFVNTERHRLAAQFAWQREDSDRKGRNIVGQSSGTGSTFYLFVDPNTKLLDGRPNPYAGRAYLGVGEPIHTSNPLNRDSYRAQLAYQLDLTQEKSLLKWFGRQQLLGYYEERKSRSFSFRYREAMISPNNAVYAPAGQSKANQATTNGFGPATIATRNYLHFYVGDGPQVTRAPYNYATGNYTFNWFNAVAPGYAQNAWVSDQVTLGEAGITEGTAGTTSVLNLIKTKGALIQSSFLQDRLVTTFGRREDENRNKSLRPPVLMADGYSFDYAAMNGWVGDWALRSGKTKTSGVVAKPFRGWSFIDRQRQAGGATGFVGNLLSGATVYYNKSDSFRPEIPAISITLEDLPNPSSVGKDYGFTLNLSDKFVLRANKYETRQVNSRAGQSAIFAQRTGRVDFERFAGNNDAISLQRQARVWLSGQGLSGTALDAAIANVMKIPAANVSRYNNETLAETSDVISKGNEIELNYNPTSYWTLRGNITRQSSIDANLSPHIPAWIAQRLVVWESIIDPRTGTKWLDTGYNGDSPAAGSGTPRQFLQGNVISPLAIVQATEGKRRPETREWRVNVNTNYRLAGLFQNEHLKRMNVGGALRWESKGAIGYYGIPINGDIGAATQLDPNRPIWNRAHLTADLLMGYTTRVYHDKWRARFQLNVRNIDESHARLQKVGAYPDGRGHSFRIVEPRQFIFTTSLDL